MKLERSRHIDLQCFHLSDVRLRQFMNARDGAFFSYKLEGKLVLVDGSIDRHLISMLTWKRNKVNSLEDLAGLPLD